MSATLVDIPPISRLSSNVIRILGCNPSLYTLQGTNTYLVGTGSKRILIDTGEGQPEWKDLVAKVLKDENCSIDIILLTHHHYDHIGGIEDVNDLVGDKVAVYKYDGDGFNNITDQQLFKTEGAELLAIHSPGHTDDHVAFLMDKTLFTGDAILGQGTSVFEDLKKYIDGLKKLEAYDSSILYPAHGPVVEEGNAKITEYIHHRLEREKQILNALDKARNVKDIIEVVYDGYPDSLKMAARPGVLMHLGKLSKEGKVEEKNSVWSKL